jgi:hypothetical protein
MDMLSVALVGVRGQNGGSRIHLYGGRLEVNSSASTGHEVCTTAHHPLAKILYNIRTPNNYRKRVLVFLQSFSGIRAVIENTSTPICGIIARIISPHTVSMALPSTIAHRGVATGRTGLCRLLIYDIPVMALFYILVTMTQGLWDHTASGSCQYCKRPRFHVRRILYGS